MSRDTQTTELIAGLVGTWAARKTLERNAPASNRIIFQFGIVPFTARPKNWPCFSTRLMSVWLQNLAMRLGRLAQSRGALDEGIAMNGEIRPNLRKQIVDAHRDLLVNERILDLEDQVKSLVEQVNKAKAEKEEMWQRYRSVA